jgi:hypothetical protein
MPTMEVLVRLPDGLPAMVDAVRHERPLLMRMLRHVSEMAQHRASLSLFSSFLACSLSACCLPSPA